MLTSQYGVLHTRTFSHSRERARIPICRIKGLGRRVIFLDADALRVGQRADPSDQRPRQLKPTLAAMSPMNKHPEPSFVEPRFHSGAFSPSSEAVVYSTGQIAEVGADHSRLNRPFPIPIPLPAREGVSG